MTRCNLSLLDFPVDTVVIQPYTPHRHAIKLPFNNLTASHPLSPVQPTATARKVASLS